VSKDLLNLREAAEYLNTTERQVRRLVSLRAFPYIKVGGLLRFRVSDLDAYLSAQTVPARVRGLMV
jgi:hypothetical protein